MGVFDKGSTPLLPQLFTLKFYFTMMELSTFKRVSKEILDQSRTLNQTIKAVNNLLNSGFAVGNDVKTLGEWLKESGVALNANGKITLKSFIEQFDKGGNQFEYYSSYNYTHSFEEIAPNGKPCVTTYKIYKTTGTKYVPLKYWDVATVCKDKWSISLLLKVIEFHLYNQEWNEKFEKSYAKCCDYVLSNTTYGFRDRKDILAGKPKTFTQKDFITY